MTAKTKAESTYDIMLHWDKEVTKAIQEGKDEAHIKDLQRFLTNAREQWKQHDPATDETITERGIETMTVRIYISGKLEENGMFADMAEQVMLQAEKSELLTSMKERWGDNVEDYKAPEFLSVPSFPFTQKQHPALVTTWIAVRTVALDWIDKNLPEAGFRPMFA